MISFVYGTHYTSFNQADSFARCLLLFLEKKMPSSFPHWTHKILSPFPILSQINICSTYPHISLLDCGFEYYNPCLDVPVGLFLPKYRTKIFCEFPVPCPFHYFCFVCFSVSCRPKSRFRDAGQYLTVTAFPFSVLLETFDSAVFKLAVLFSCPQLLHSKVLFCCPFRSCCTVMYCFVVLSAAVAQ